MGDIKRKRKQYTTPKKLFDAKRIAEENDIVKSYGLKNKREIWKADTQISKIRGMAKDLIPKSEEEKKKFFEKLNKMGLKVSSISDALALKKEDWLNRRLQTFVFKKNLARTAKQARQLITHRHILVNGKVVNVPSMIVTTELENKISLKEGRIKTKEMKELEDGKK